MSASMIFIDRLKEGKTQKIDEQIDSAFLGPDEDELKFYPSVSVTGEAYLTEDHLIIRLHAKTKVSMPCAICNKMTDVNLVVENFTHAEALENIDTLFDYREQLRENILIELPRTVECSNGKCPERKAIAPFMKSKDQTHFPFADMDKENLGDKPNGRTP